MSGVQCKEQKLVGLYCNSLLDPAICSLLQEYQSLLQGLVGPFAGTILVQHAGGLDSYVNSSSELIKKLRPHHPCLKFINCIIEAQHVSYGCLSLYAGILCTSLLRELLSLEQQSVPHRVVKDVTNICLEEVLNYLKTKPLKIISKLDLSSISQMFALVSTSLGSKNIGLNSFDKDALTGKILEAFLKTIPSEKQMKSFGDVIITVIEGRPTEEAEVLSGVLVRELYPNMLIINKIKQKLKPKFAVQKKCKPSATQQIIMSRSFCKYSHNFMDTGNHKVNETSQKSQKIRIIIFNIPLSFQQPETECLSSSEGSNEELFNNLVSDKLKLLVCAESVDIIACQKVISPTVQWELEKCNVLVLERLGTVTTEALRKLSGCKIVSDLTTLMQLTDHRNSNTFSKNATIHGYDLHQSKESIQTNHHFASHGYIGHLTNIAVVEMPSSGRCYIQLENNPQFADDSLNMDVEPFKSHKMKNELHNFTRVPDKLHFKACENDPQNENVPEENNSANLSHGDTQSIEPTVVTLLLPVLLPAMADSIKVGNF